MTEKGFITANSGDTEVAGTLSIAAPRALYAVASGHKPKKNPEELLPASPADRGSGIRLIKSEDRKKDDITNRPARSTYPKKKSVLTSGATPYRPAASRQRREDNPGAESGCNQCCGVIMKMLSPIGNRFHLVFQFREIWFQIFTLICDVIFYLLCCPAHGIFPSKLLTVLGMALTVLNRFEPALSRIAAMMASPAATARAAAQSGITRVKARKAVSKRKRMKKMPLSAPSPVSTLAALAFVNSSRN